MTLRSTPAGRISAPLGPAPGRTAGGRLPRSVTTPLRRLRQRVLLWRRPLSAVLAALAVLAVLRASAEPVEERRPVMVARTDLVAGRPLTAGDLTVQELPVSAVPDGAAGSADGAVLLGRVLAGPVRRGEPVTDVRLVSPGILDGYPGLVAVPLRVADAGAVALLRVGDRVDVVATGADGASSSVVASRAPVVALPRPEPDGALGGGPVGGGLLGGGLVVVAVPEGAAPALAGRSVSSVLSVILRQ